MNSSVTTNSFVAPFETIYRNWSFLSRTTMAEVRHLHAGSVLGHAWLVCGPLLMLGVYAVTFAAIFQVRPPDLDMTEYILYVFSGLIPFLCFSASLSAGASSLVNNRHLLLTTSFPLELIPLRAVLVSCVGMPVGILILFLGDLLLSKVTITWLFLPVIVIAELMFLAGVSWLLSLAALVFRDIQQIITYVMMMLMVMTPIAYTPSMIPRQLALLIYLNPASYFVMSFQSVLIMNELPSFKITAIMLSISAVAFFGGYSIYRRIRNSFHDFA